MLLLKCEKLCFKKLSCKILLWAIGSRLRRHEEAAISSKTTKRVRIGTDVAQKEYIVKHVQYTVGHRCGRIKFVWPGESSFAQKKFTEKPLICVEISISPHLFVITVNKVNDKVRIDNKFCLNLNFTLIKTQAELCYQGHILNAGEFP